MGDNSLHEPRTVIFCLEFVTSQSPVQKKSKNFYLYERQSHMFLRKKKKEKIALLLIISNFEYLVLLCSLNLFCCNQLQLK
jgi:hypothetical protein